MRGLFQILISFCSKSLFDKIVIGVETKSSNSDRRGSKNQEEDDGEEIVRYFCRMGVVLALGPW